MISRVLGVLALALEVVLKWFGRNPKAHIDPKIKEALKVREEISKITERQLLALQRRDIERLQHEVDDLYSRLNALTFLLHKSNPTKK